MIPAFDTLNGNGGQTVWFDSTYGVTDDDDENPQQQ